MSSQKPKLNTATGSRSGRLELKFVTYTFLITTTIIVMSCVGIFLLHNKGVYRVAEKEFTSVTNSIKIPLQHLFKHSHDHGEKFQPIVRPFINEILAANKEKAAALFVYDSNYQVLLASNTLLPVSTKDINFKTFKKHSVHVIDKNWMVITIPMSVTHNSYFLSIIYSLDTHFAAVKHNLIQPLIVIGATYILIIVLLAFFVARKMIQPLKKMTHAIKHSFPGEEYHDTSSAVQLNEFGELEALFNDLLSQLNHKYEEEKLTQQKLMHADKLVTIGTLAAGVAHEVNNPITGMQSCMAHIRKLNEDNPKVLRYIEPVDQSIQHIKNAVRGLLDYSRPRNYSFEKTNLTSIITNAEKVINPQISRSKTSLSISVEHGSCTGHWDQNSLEQVTVNLILNALHAIDSEEGSISITSTLNTDTVSLSISDTGPGIPDEISAKIFEPFFTTKAQGKGTGLGLAVCKNIIDAHNGTIQVYSNQDKGTTFTITLPFLSDSDS